MRLRGTLPATAGTTIFAQSPHPRNGQIGWNGCYAGCLACSHPPNFQEHLRDGNEDGVAGTRGELCPFSEKTTQELALWNVLSSHLNLFRQEQRSGAASEPNRKWLNAPYSLD
jgi:hypothetical protein